ncbi:hypothetical protein BKA67DRAFT_570611, partial [Truncatella angustata]
MHTRPQKIKISRSGPSLKRKAKALGVKANVLSVLMYHNAIDNRMEMEVHVPKDLKKLPDFNKLVCIRPFIFHGRTRIMTFSGPKSH